MALPAGHTPAVRIAFASGKPDLIPAFLDAFDLAAPDGELFVVSELPPPRGRWIPYRFDLTIAENRSRIQSITGARALRFAAVILQPGAQYRQLKRLALTFNPLRTLFFNEALGHFMFRPRSAASIARHSAWRARSFLRFQLNPGGTIYTWAWRLAHPRELQRPLFTARALIAGRAAARRRVNHAVPPAAAAPLLPRALPPGVSVIIPTRDGRGLLETLLPLLLPELESLDHQVIIVDNGSTDDSAGWLARHYPQLETVVSTTPLSFARAINTGLAHVRYSHVCLLNNDMHPRPGFFPPLVSAFEAVPDLFCATAQIFFPEGKRREETGKAVAVPPPAPGVQSTDFPLTCIDPIPGEGHSYVLYGSGGCSLYDTAKLQVLGGLSEIYQPAYVEDLDIGFQAWQRGWPTVFVAEAEVVHRHRATTSRFHSGDDLDAMVERNYLKFLAHAIQSPALFRRSWRAAINRLTIRAAVEHHAPSLAVLSEAAAIASMSPRPSPPPVYSDEFIYGIGSGEVAVFRGRAASRDRNLLVASSYLPFPLSHGGAVRIFNLMLRAEPAYGQVLIAFVDELQPPPAELLDLCLEVILVRRVGSHLHLDRELPDVVQDFHSDAFHAALRLAVAKWRPALVQLEFTQMAQYAPSAAPARTLLVEHDITIDLYAKLLATEDNIDVREQLRRWTTFEHSAWRKVDCVVVMSRKDAAMVREAPRVEVLANGVDVERFQPCTDQPEPARLLFIGSFAHLPNLLALDFFLRSVWQLLAPDKPRLHVIAGVAHLEHLERFRHRVSPPLELPGVSVEGFVPDVRPAYRAAEVVIAPLLASAGTNIKILEAMAMGKAIVSTTHGVNGLDVAPGVNILVHDDPAEFAAAVTTLCNDNALRQRIERNARALAIAAYGWNAIARAQIRLYDDLIKS